MAENCSCIFCIHAILAINQRPSGYEPALTTNEHKRTPSHSINQWNIVCYIVTNVVYEGTLVCWECDGLADQVRMGI